MAPRRTAPQSRKVIDIYCRISRDYDGTLRSVEAQEEACRAAIEVRARDGWEVGKVHRDHALSAWNPKVRRHEFEELMRRLESGEADGVMVRNLDRFTRKMTEGEMLLKVAKAGRIVVALDGHYDMLSARGQKNFYEDLVDAQYESHRLSERTARGKRDKARRGKSNASNRGFARPGFLPNPEGWEQGDARIPVPEAQLAEEREVVRQMTTRLLAGNSLDSIVRDLNERGIQTVMGKRWTAMGVRQLLKAPSLAGLVEHKGEIIEGVALEGEPVLDRETWDALQSHFAGRKRGRPASTYLLSGIARCGRCGEPLYGRPRTHMKPYDDGEVRREYWCTPRAHGGGCGRLTIDQRYADTEVKKAVLRRLGDPRHASAVAKKAAAVDAARGKVAEEIARLEDDAANLASKTGTWGLARVEAAMDSIDKQLAKARAKFAAIDGPDALLVPVDDVAERWEKAAAEGQVTALRSMVKAAFPLLAIGPATSRGPAALTPDRFLWDGQPG